MKINVHYFYKRLSQIFIWDWDMNLNLGRKELGIVVCIELYK